MAQLDNIPNEILRHIFTYVSDTNHSSIFNVILVNKHFNQIATPLRVRHWSDEGYYGYYHGSSPCPPISRLALELLRHPEYRLQVKSLSFSWFQSSHDRDPARVPLSSENLQMLAWAAEELVPTLAETTYLCAKILEDNDDAIAVVVLAWATNLTSLSITVPFFDPTPNDGEGSIVLRFAKQLALRFSTDDPKPSAPLPLAKLRDLEFRHNDTEDDVALKYFSPFFYLPSLKNVKAYRLGDQESNDSEETVQRYINDSYCMPLPKGTSSIESIILEETTLSSDGLKSLLSAPKALKTFKLELCSTAVYSETWETALANSLFHHAASLEELDLCSNLTYPFGTSPSDDVMSLKDCYGHLTSLKRLSISLLDVFYFSPDEVNPGNQDLLYNPDLLPESIGHLKLCDSDLFCGCRDSRERDYHDCEISFYLMALGVITDAAGPQRRLRNLKVIDCSQSLRDDPKVEMIQEVKESAKKQDITLLLRAM
ncbi:hypothetical protein FBEOM_7688 [Fusarium beomiforme]|uniref:F-box domain-containing protein n=1 Tax=Fusarium beomiforme TaxID=44412 RepID=A0A9P5AH89_9HYPO|nr:hypothetical protein FBEOM_7688 [Fusarium beomiforme]